MVVAEEMNKPTLKVSMGDSESSSEEESDISENEADSDGENVEADANSVSSNDDKSESDISENESGSEGDDESDNSGSSDDDDQPDVQVTNEGGADSVTKIVDSKKHKNKQMLLDVDSEGEDASDNTSDTSNDEEADAEVTNEGGANSVGSRKRKNQNTLVDVDSEDEDDSDAGSISSNDEKPEGLVTNEGWADSVTKILGSSKPKNKKTLVLSRAKKHSDIVKIEKEEKPSFEVIGESSEKKSDIGKEIPSSQDTSEPPVKKVKTEKSSIRHKPNVLEKDREKLLSKIATKGVVQLFNAVRNQQKTLEKDLDRNDLTEGKKEKILKKFDKRTFLDTLMGKSKSIVVDEEAKGLKSEFKNEDHKPKWSALRDDFMMGAKMKDWDKESVDE